MRDAGPTGSPRDAGVAGHAATGPVTFMPAGQPIFEETTIGGWYQATDSLRQQLISLGLPDRKALGSATSPNPAPANSQLTPATPASPPPAWPRVAAVVAGLLLVVAGAAVSLRRRRAATAAH